MFKNIMFQITGTLLAIAVLAYLVIHTMTSFENELEVKNSYYTTMDLTYDAEAYIFRDETVLSTKNSGDVIYNIENGKKVSSHQKVASVFSDSQSADAQNKIQALEKEIDYLEKVINNATFSTPTVTSLDKNINERIKSVSAFSNLGDLKNALKVTEESIYDLELKYCILKGTVAHQNLIEQYKNEINSLTQNISSSVSPVYSTKSGYFYNEADGFEDVFTLDAVESLTAESFEELKNCSPSIAPNAGKIAESSKWYIAFELDSQSSLQISVGKKYPVAFSASGISINMKAERKIDGADDSTKIIVLSTNTVNENFNFSRKQIASITVATYSGIAFPAKAVHTDYDSTGASKAGVYVLDETIVKFKTFTKLIEKNGFILCAVPDSTNISAISEEKVSLYDTIIVEGTNLYNNKVIKSVLKTN